MTPTGPADPHDADATRLARAALARGDATGWFDELYLESATAGSVVPWDSGEPNPVLVGWAGTRPLRGRAVVVGAGRGRDAELIASLGADTTAFDISPAAVEQAMARHPGSPVRYVAADLFALPTDWYGAFDLVVESYTVQSLPVELHERAIDAVVSLLAPGGTLVATGHIGTSGADAGGPPWPLVPAEIDRFAAGGSRVVRRDEPQPGRWLLELART